MEADAPGIADDRTHRKKREREATIAEVIRPDAFAPQVHEAFSQISHRASPAPFVTTPIRAVFAGWLIALMVWMLPATSSAAPFIVLGMTGLAAVCGLAHVFTGEASIANDLWHVFVPTRIGNVFSGTALVAVLDDGQVAPEVEEEEAGDGAG